MIPLVTEADVAFWIAGPLAVLGALGLVLFRKAVYAALSMAFTMVNLAVLYASLDAMFLTVVQIIVYTGAIMMLFLFVLMLTGRDAGDSVIEVLRGQRVAAGLLGLGLVGLLVAVLMHAVGTLPNVGLTDAIAERGAVGSLAASIFTTYLFPFELTSALLITAAVGAMVLAHVERTKRERRSQKATVLARMRSDRMSPLPGPGVHATSASNATPAMLPDGSIAPGSVSHLVEMAVSEQVARRFREGELVPINGPEHPYRPKRAAIDHEGSAENIVIPAVSAASGGSAGAAHEGSES